MMQLIEGDDFYDKYRKEIVLCKTNLLSNCITFTMDSLSFCLISCIMSLVIK